MVVSICRKCVGLSAQKINFIPLFYLEILQDFVNVLFWVLWASLNMPNKIDGQLVEKINVYLHVKNQVPHSFLSWDVAKILQTYSGYFGHVWLWPRKMAVSTCRKFWCLPLCKKIKFTPYIFPEISLRYWNLHNPHQKQ